MKAQRFISGIIACCMALTQAGTVLAAANSGPFSDVAAGSQYATAIQYLKDKGLINGYPDGTFKPNRVVNRAEALKMIMGIDDFKYWDRADGAIAPGAEDEYSKKPFTDVADPNAWFYSYVHDAFNNMIISGYPDGTFKPAQQVNRAEALKMLMEHTFMRIDHVTGVYLYVPTFSDISINDWYRPYVIYAQEKSIITESTTDKFNAAEGMTRGALADLIYKTYLADEAAANAPSVSLNTTTNQFEVSYMQKVLATLPGTYPPIVGDTDVMKNGSIIKVTKNYAYASICTIGISVDVYYNTCDGDTYQVNLITGKVENINFKPPAEDVFTTKISNFMDVSADESLTAWTAPDGKPNHYILIAGINDDATYRTITVDSKWEQFGDVKFSPDGTKIAYAAVAVSYDQNNGDASIKESAVFSVNLADGIQTLVIDRVGTSVEAYRVMGWDDNNTVNYSNDLYRGL